MQMLFHRRLASRSASESMSSRCCSPTETTGDGLPGHERRASRPAGSRGRGAGMGRLGPGVLQRADGSPRLGGRSIACGWNARLTMADWPTRHGALAATERSIGLIRLTGAVLRRAGLPMPTSVKTLDAIQSGERVAARRAARGRFGVRHLRSTPGDGSQGTRPSTWPGRRAGPATFGTHDRRFGPGGRKCPARCDTIRYSVRATGGRDGNHADGER